MSWVRAPSPALAARRIDLRAFFVPARAAAPRGLSSRRAAPRIQCILPAGLALLGTEGPGRDRPTGGTSHAKGSEPAMTEENRPEAQPTEGTPQAAEGGAEATAVATP